MYWKILFVWFNNSGIFNEEYGAMERKYFNLGMNSFKDFINKLNGLKNENMKESYEVQKKRFEVEEQQNEFKTKIEELQELNKEFDYCFDRNSRTKKIKKFY